MKQKSLKRILVLLFGAAFVGSTVFMLVGSLFGRQQSQISPADSTVSNSVPEVNSNNNLNSRLKAQIIGYEKLLEKEPENTTILTNLVRIKLETGDLEGAVEPLTRLAKLQPERAELVAILEEIEAKLAEQQAVEKNQTP